MVQIASRPALRDVAYTGITAGLMFIGYSMVATAFSTAATPPLLPLRMAGAIVLGPAALDASYSSFVAGITGLAVHLLLSIIFAALFVEIVSLTARYTEGEYLATSAERAFAGTAFGMVLWLVNFYVLAPLAGWTWFPGNDHHSVAFIGHAFFFGCPLGWMSSRVGHAPRVRAR